MDTACSASEPHLAGDEAWSGRQAASQLPTFAVGRRDVGVGFTVIGEAHLLVVPFQSFGGEAEGDGTDEGNLGKGAAIIEVRTCLPTSADGIKPIPVVSFDARNFLRWRVFAGEFVHEFVRREITATGTVRAVDNHAFIPEENGAGARDFVIRGEGGGTWDGFIAIVPDEGDGPATAFGRELVSDFAGGRIGGAIFGEIVTGHFGADGFRGAEIERPEGGVDDVTKPIADGASAKMHPTTPVPGDPKGSVGDKRNRTDPEIVIEVFGDIVVLFGFFEVRNLAVDVFEGIATGMNGVDLTDGAGPDPFAELADGAAGVALVAELGDHFIFMGCLHQRADFVDIVGERFFAINMFTAAHGFHGNDRVGVVGCADDDGVNFLTHFIEHDAVICKALGVGMLGEFLAGVFGVNIAEGNDVLHFGGDFIEVGTAAAADADASDVYFVIGGEFGRAAEG